MERDQLTSPVARSQFQSPQRPRLSARSTCARLSASRLVRTRLRTAADCQMPANPTKAIPVAASRAIIRRAVSRQCFIIWLTFALSAICPGMAVKFLTAA